MADPSRLFSFKPHFALCALSEAFIHVTVFHWEKIKIKIKIKKGLQGS